KARSMSSVMSSGRTGPKRNGDLPIVFEGREANVLNVRTAGTAERRRQLMTRHQFAAHDVLVQHTVVNQRTGSPFDPYFQLLALESHDLHGVLEGDQGVGGNEPAHDIVVA